MIDKYPKSSILFLVMLTGFKLIAQRAFDPYLSSLGYDVKPYTSIGQQGTYTFIFGNLGVCQMPVSRGIVTMTIRMSQDTVLPATGNPLNDLSGPYVPYFSWTYSASNNAFTGVQTSTIPDVNFTSGNITNGAGLINVSVIYAIGTPSSMNFGQGGNGVFVSLDVPAYALGASNPAVPDCSITQTGGNTNNDMVRAFNYLPINMSKFSVKKNTDKLVYLDWTTLSERNSIEFEIHRSINTLQNHWKVIGKVPAAGHSSREIRYHFEDADLPASDMLYYRLKLIDSEGDARFTEIKSVQQKISAFFAETYPNPTKNQVNLRIQSKNEGIVSIEIIDILGRTISREIMALDGGSQIKVFDLGQFTSGPYSINVSGKSGRISMTVFKLD